eukprot:SAG31_NODE_2205_length_6195_cov_4.592520_5_plen_195_part_00
MSVGITAGPVPSNHSGTLDQTRAVWFTDGPSSTVNFIEIVEPCSSADDSGAHNDEEAVESFAVTWPERECDELIVPVVFVDHSVHSAGCAVMSMTFVLQTISAPPRQLLSLRLLRRYMNISAFLDIDDYADAELHHCGGGDITQSAAMAGMPTSGRINNVSVGGSELSDTSSAAAVFVEKTKETITPLPFLRRL